MLVIQFINHAFFILYHWVDYYRIMDYYHIYMYGFQAELLAKMKSDDIPKSLAIFEKLLTVAKSEYFCLKKVNYKLV